MAPSRTSAMELVRLLDAAGCPVYIVNDQRRIIFANEACAEWAGITRDELLGVECRYHSSGELTGAEAVAAGLCPPPEALAGRRTMGKVHAQTADDELVWRRAEFWPLAAGPDDVVGVIALVTGADETESSSDEVGNQDAPAQLHQRLQVYRDRLRGRYRPESLAGKCPAIIRVRAQVHVAAACRANVLVVGPPGSGRQHVARAIHYAQAGDPGPLAPLACGLLSAELLMTTISSLARTQTERNAGAMATLVLGDVESLPVEVQVDLAGRIAAGRFPLRIVATARELLTAAVRRGEFREDLACALATLVIELPPLTERLVDLPLLAQAFLEESNAQGDKQLGGFTSDALDLLAAYSWPSGIDELADVVRQSHARAEGHEVTAADLPPRIKLAADAAARPAHEDQTILLEEVLARIETDLIQRAIARAKGNKTKAARLLGMNRPRFYRRLVQLGLEKE